MGAKKGKLISQEKVIIGDRSPKIINNPDSFYGQTPVWSFSRCDFEHEKWGICRSLDYVEGILSRLKSYEGQTWRQILTDTAGRRSNTKNHAIEIHKMCREAQTRLSDINLDEFDALYSLTITGKQRLWGIIIEGVFCVLWFDKEHEICPSNKKNT